MDLYDKNINVLTLNIQKNKIEKPSDIILMEYFNDPEKKTIFDLLSQYNITHREDILERIHNVLEIEIIFSAIWDLDERECVSRLMKFDLNKVYGSSFIAEFVKLIKVIEPINVTSSTEFRNLYGVMTLKFFKSKRCALEYFETFMDNVKDVQGVNISETRKQLDKFLEIFPNQ